MNILWVSLIIGLVGIGLTFLFKIKFIMIGVSLLWFVPIIEVDNMFIKVVSAIMFIATIYYTLYSEKNEGFE